MRANVRTATVTAAVDSGTHAIDYARNKSDEFKLNPSSKTRGATKYQVYATSRQVRLRLWNAEKVARYLEDGTPPHTIAAKRKKALAFRVNGKWLFRKRVHHPGTKATHWFRNLANETFTHLGRGLKRRLVKVADKFKRYR